jgi:hypothetical protein
MHQMVAETTLPLSPGTVCLNCFWPRSRICKSLFDSAPMSASLAFFLLKLLCAVLKPPSPQRMSDLFFLQFQLYPLPISSFHTQYIQMSSPHLICHFIIVKCYWFISFTAATSNWRASRALIFVQWWGPRPIFFLDAAALVYQRHMCRDGNLLSLRILLTIRGHPR